MAASSDSGLTPWYVRAGGALGIGLVLAGILYASSQLEPSGYSWPVVPSFALVTWAVWEAVAWLTVALGRRYPWASRPLARTLWQGLGSAGLTLVVVLVPYSLYKWYSLAHWERPGSRYSGSILAFTSGLALLLGALVTALHLGLRFLGEWRAAELTRERLLREGAQARFAALNSHLNPHFIFNSLNVLSAMLDEQQAVPREFIAQFAQLYRYILAVKDQEAVPLAAELGHVAPFSFILTQRFAGALRIELPGAELAGRWLVPPLCVQMLVENAVQHNIIDEQRPLRVRIGVEAAPGGRAYLVVQNNYQPRPSPPPAARPGTGLANIRHRYQYLSDQAVLVEQTAACFTVKLPLLALLDAA